MLVTVRLYGHLRQFGIEHSFDVLTVGEVFAALSVNYSEFTNVANDGSMYCIMVNDQIMPADFLQFKATEGMVIKVVPVVAGGAFIPAAIMAGLAYIGSTIAASGFLTTLVINIGISLAMAGIRALLTDEPNTTSSPAKQSNNISFTNVTDTIQQGDAIPVVFGKVLCDVMPISLKVTVVQGEQ